MRQGSRGAACAGAQASGARPARFFAASDARPGGVGGGAGAAGAAGSRFARFSKKHALGLLQFIGDWK